MASTLRLRAPPEESKLHMRQGMEDDEFRYGSRKTGHTALLLFDQMPEWFQHGNNGWVLRGYRPISNSISASFRSLRSYHNETVNIYSHLIPAIVLFLGECYILRYLAGRYPRATSSDLLAFSVFVLMGATCFASSALYHTFMNHSHTMDHFCHRLIYSA